VVPETPILAGRLVLGRRGRSGQRSVADFDAVTLSWTVDPAEDEVADSSAECHGQTQVEVERHEDEHQRQTDPQLDEVQQRLEPMDRTQDADSPAVGRHTITTLLVKIIS